jgi:hypothetical protein
MYMTAFCLHHKHRFTFAFTSQFERFRFAQNETLNSQLSTLNYFDPPDIALMTLTSSSFRNFSSSVKTSSSRTTKVLSGDKLSSLSNSRTVISRSNSKVWSRNLTFKVGTTSLCRRVRLILVGCEAQKKF